jgi:twitching motility protein PilT
MHANGVVRSIDRIIDVFPPDGRHQARSSLSEVLEAVVSQRLVFNGDGGSRGRISGEVARATPALRTLIREGKTHQIPGLIEISRGAGMVCF